MYIVYLDVYLYKCFFYQDIFLKVLVYNRVSIYIHTICISMVYICVVNQNYFTYIYICNVKRPVKAI